MRTQSDTIPPSIPPRGNYVRVSRAMPHRRLQCRQCEPVNLLIASFSPFLATVTRATRRVAPPAWTALLPRFATSNELDLPRRRLRNISSGILQHRVNTIEQFVVAKWLGELTRRPSIHRLGARAVIGESGNEDDRDYGARRDQAFLQFKAVHARHMDIQDKARCLGQAIGTEIFFRRGKCFHGDAIRFHQAPNRFPYRIVVVYDHAYDLIDGHGLPPAAKGKVKPKTVPKGDPAPAHKRP